jgi:DNA-binding SARP family transcriptional activator
VTGTRRLEIHLLGRFVVLLDGQEIPAAEFGGRKVRTLLRVLATRRGRFVSNDALTEMLWPVRPPVDPAANVQVLVTRARKALGDPRAILTGDGGYALSAEEWCSVDAERFLGAVDDLGDAPTLASMEAALGAWCGDPLAEDVYADWAVDYRSRLLRARQDTLERAATLAHESGRHATAIGYASTAAEADPLRETAVLILVRALAAAGDPAAALLRYDSYRRALADELGVDPSPAAASLHRELLGGRGASTAEPRRSTGTFTGLPFVGRDSELRSMRAALGEGLGGATVVLTGDSGVGKSRLATMLTVGTPSVLARAVRPERAEPWSLVRTLVREVLAEDVEYADALPAPLADAVAALLPEREPGTAATADPQSLRALLQEAVLRLLSAADRTVVIDDLQWADPSSLEVLEAARSRLPGLRLLVVHRPEEVAAAVSAFLGRLQADLRVDLGGLTPEAIGDLVAGPGLAAELHTHTDGAPLAIGEVLRVLIEEGLVVRRPDGGYRGVDPAASARAAALGRQGKKHAIGVRAGRQSPEARRVLELICVLAREVSVGTLQRAGGGSEADLLERLGELFGAGLVRFGEYGWTTAHDVVSEAVVEQLGAAQAAGLHAVLAAALEAEDGDPAELARHWLAAGETARAADAFARAAQRALAHFADQEAATLAGSGLALGELPSVAGVLRETRAEALARLGDIPAARRDFRVALAGCRRGPARARVLGRLAVLASGADDLVRAGELAELAVVEAGDDRAARAGALEVACVLDMNLDRTERAEERSAEALELYRDLGDASGTARVLDGRAMATFLAGDIEGGGAALRQAADLFEDTGDLVRVVTPRSTSGHALVFAGRAVDGLAAATSALDLARTLGHPEGQAYALWHRAEALADLARAPEALSDAHEALDIATRLGHRGWTATSWRAVGIASQAAGDLPGALRAYQHSLEASEHLGLFASWAAARAALVLVAMGACEQARPLVARALAEGPPLGHYEARAAQAELAEATGDPRAPDLAREALALATVGGARQGLDRLTELATRSAPGVGRPGGPPGGRSLSARAGRRDPGGADPRR